MTVLSHWSAENLVTASSLLTPKNVGGQNFVLNTNPSTATAPNSNYPITRGSATMRKTLTVPDPGTDEEIGHAYAWSIFTAGVVTIEYVFRMESGTAFYHRIFKNGTFGTRYEFYFGVQNYGSNDGDIYGQHLDYVSSSEQGDNRINYIRKAYGQGVIKFGELAHLGLTLDLRAAYPRFTSFLNGELLSDFYSTRPINSGWLSGTQSYSLVDNTSGGGVTKTQFAELMLHTTPLTLGLARSRARYIRWFNRIRGV